MAKWLPIAFRKTGRAAARTRRGTTATEMALLAPVFFVMLIGIIEMSLVLTAQQIMENATFNASRLAKTGFVAQGQTQAQTINQILNNELKGYGKLLDITKVQTTSTAYNSFAASGAGGGGANGFGQAQQIVVYTVTYPWPLFTPLIGRMIGTWNKDSSAWVINLNSQIVVRNEPFG